MKLMDGLSRKMQINREGAKNAKGKLATVGARMCTDRKRIQILNFESEIALFYPYASGPHLWLISPSRPSRLRGKNSSDGFDTPKG
jgi:hypothetical protein